MTGKLTAKSLMNKLYAMGRMEENIIAQMKTLGDLHRAVVMERLSELLGEMPLEPGEKENDDYEKTRMRALLADMAKKRNGVFVPVRQGKIMSMLDEVTKTGLPELTSLAMRGEGRFSRRFRRACRMLVEEAGLEIHAGEIAFGMEDGKGECRKPRI